MKKLKTFLADSCILFTVFVFILYIAGNILVSATITLSLSSIALLFLCCLVLRAINGILHIKKLSMALRILIHYLVIVLFAYVVFALIAKIVSTSLATFVMLLIVTLVYSAVCVTMTLIGQKKKENENQSKEYKSIF